MGNVKSYPEYKHALELFFARKFVEGDLITHEWLGEALDLTPPQSLDHKVHKAFWIKRMELVESFKNDLLFNHRIYLENVQGKGYKYIKVQDQTKSAMDWFGAKFKNMAKSTVNKLTHIKHEELTDKQKVENMNALAKIGGLRALANKRPKLLES